jgi:hypothetical protein
MARGALVAWRGRHGWIRVPGGDNVFVGVGALAEIADVGARIRDDCRGRPKEPQGRGHSANRAALSAGSQNPIWLWWSRANGMGTLMARDPVTGRRRYTAARMAKRRARQEARRGLQAAWAARQAMAAEAAPDRLAEISAEWRRFTD